MSTLPSVFIGSSSEGIDVAREIELQIKHDAETRIWQNGVFKLGDSSLESLINSLEQFDFAIMSLTPDDMTESRSDKKSSPRDNVIFELGLFMGRLGRNRTFIIHGDNDNMKIPSDLHGIHVSRYRNGQSLETSLSPACTPIIRAIRSLGKYEGRVNAQLNRATQDMEGASDRLSKLTKRLIQSRITELKIVRKHMSNEDRLVADEDLNELEALLAQSD